MRGWVYWPESGGAGACNFVGYNHAIGLLQKAVGDFISPTSLVNAKCRLYCNIPWHHNPSELKKDKLPLVAYTMFEATKLPNHWRNFLNKHCIAIIVPTDHCKQMFRLSKVTRPIKVAALGVDEAEKSYIPIQEHEGYNFLWQGHNYDPAGRKGGGFVEQAFKELKREERIGQDAALFLKYRPHEDYPTEMDFVPVGDNIFHISMTMSIEKLNELYRMTDCCVNPSHGEGFGLIPLEQMAIGRPVLLTNWSFPFINDNYNIPINYEMKKSPVRWCHKHFSFGKFGYDYTWNKLLREHYLPFLIPEPANGEIEVGPNFVETRSEKTLKKTLIRAVSKTQKFLRLYRQPNKKTYTIMFEHPGYDAWVNIEDLKNKMEQCYNHKAFYAEMGRRASQYVLNNWGLDRIKREFTNAIKEFYQEGVFNGC